MSEITYLKHKDKCESCGETVGLNVIILHWEAREEEGYSYTVCTDCYYKIREMFF